MAILSSSTLQITGLQSMSVVDAPTSSGPVRVIELKMSGSTIGGLDLLDPCAGHVRMHTTATQQQGTGGLTIDATAVQITVLGVTIILAASDLPVGPLTLPGVSLPPLPTDVGLTSVTMYVLTISAGSAGLTSTSVTPAPC